MDMPSPVRQGEQRVSWATRTDSSSSSSSHSSVSLANRALVSDAIPEESGSPGNPASSPPSAKFFPERMVEASPLPVAPSQGRGVGKAPSILPSMVAGASAVSAPAELGTQHRGLTPSSISTKYSLDHLPPAKPQSMKHPTDEGFKLDKSAPYLAVRTDSGRQRLDEELSRVRLNSVEEREEQSDEKGDTWGESFKIEWICTERLPFHRTRHLRNPWNHDREVKVSRDGTELEPSVGEQLLEEWGKMVEEGRQQQGQVTDPASGGVGTDAKSSATRRPGLGFRSATIPGAKSTKDRESQSSRS
ncbi:YT521-B-like domain-containing protein [Rhodocollybia butyracea]|uniref:YT521-B-like domain-containing protein n=1 Tax=Rhodocollybia butyracea TaxID=206335 RepID=A0A9P5PJ57_9AGAR|nr:YT521-B-like domain-containing protein [Rhodocollybia butyracea]